MLVYHCGRRARFAGKPLPGRPAAGQVRGEDLDRHGPIQLRIKSLEDDAHAARADEPLDFIAAQPAQHFRMRRRRQKLPGHRLRPNGMPRSVQIATLDRFAPRPLPRLRDKLRIHLVRRQ